MRLLVTGAGGQLGRELSEVCGRSGDEVVAADRSVLDITDRGQVLQAITSVRPDVVVNCAAWTAVDACEGDPDRAMRANGLAVRWLAEACRRTGSHLVQISTDYVFDGTLDRPYHEHDVTGPRSAYGISKLAGEREALALGPAATVVRTSWVCGAHGANMVRTIMRLAEANPVLTFVSDQVGHPTFTADLAPVVRRLALDRLSGVVHVTNEVACSWYRFACEVVQAMGLDPDIVRPVTTAELQPPRPAPRPANSVLDNSVLRAAGYPALRDHREPLAELVALLRG
ncbi:MAG: dTDP-4-dehydrorhamnose reductase [Ilumatobacteraceae bacterium]